MLVSASADGAPGRRGRRAAQEPQAAPVQQRPPVPTYRGSIFEKALPVDIGSVVPGLANLSAQGCRGCHTEAHDGWATGPHGRAMSPRMRNAVDQSAISACATCHLPLVNQHDELPSWSRSDAPGVRNQAWDGTLRTEGVTCAACHVRDGRVLVATEAAAREAAPHPMAFAEELSDERACAACHQLTWPGADRPLYDTVGEWSRSAWKSAGVQCKDCHFRGLGPHGERPSPARAWSLVVRPDRRRIVRGTGALEVDLTLQNTGAGHTMPTGSPFRSYQLTAKITRPGEEEALDRFGELVVGLARTLSREPPWTTVADTRLPAGAERSWKWSVPFSQKVPAGGYDLLVELWRTPLDGEPVVRQRIDLVVQ